LLRHGRSAPQGVRAWTAAYRRWLDTVQWEEPALHMVWGEYLHAIDEIQERVKRLEAEIGHVRQVGVKTVGLPAELHWYGLVLI